MLKSSCPKCDQQVVIDPDPKIGQHVVCQSCKEDLMVIWLFPISLDYLETTDQISDSTDGTENTSS